MVAYAARPASYVVRLARAASWDWGMVLGLVVLAVFLVVAAIGPAVAPYDWMQINRTDRGATVGLQPPSDRFWLGTTNMGRDIFSQVLVGTRGALAVGGAAALSVVTIGLLIGLLAGYFRGWVDSVLMRLVDLAYSLPLEPIAIVVLAIVSRSFVTMVLAISLLAWRGPARVIRAQVLSVSQRPYIKAARIAGAGHTRLLFVHILPDVLPLALMYLPVAFGRAVLAEAAISFLGFGAPDLITWGQMLQQGFVAGAARTAWWWILAPGGCISAVVVSVFFVARSFEDSLNPRMRQ
ncbi:MAG: ABC transporter permease [Chloroflexi bacterium]|nr:ABC transporter permease [Chloroflexota bacterium]